MTTKDKMNTAGKEILSIDFGIGTISGTEQIQEGGADYFVVDFGSKNTKNYIPTVQNKKSRFLTEETEFLKTLKGVKAKNIVKEFQSKNERQKYFSTLLTDCNLDEMINKILEISSLKDLVPNEKDKLKKLTTILEAEASAIYKMTGPKSHEFIANFF